MQSRRELLTRLSPVLLLPFGGCNENEEGEIRLGGGQIFNGDREPHEISVVIKRNREEIHNSSSVYSRNEGDNHAKILQGNWSSEPAEYSVQASVDGSQSKKIDLQDTTNSCLELYVFVDPESQLVVLVKPLDDDSPYSC